MKKIIYLYVLLLGIVTLFASCEKDITVDLPQPEEKIAVEGYITPGSPAYVFISKTAAFFAPLDSAALLQYSVKNAIVTISDGVTTDTLIAPSPDVGYLYISPNIVGQIGKTYFLKIETEGKVLTSVTSIASPIPLDSVWFKPQSPTDSLGWVWARLSDPAVLGNCYRWFAKRIGKDADFIAPIGSVNEDKFFNGLTFDFAYNRGDVPYTEVEDEDKDEVGFFKRGDIIVVKFATTSQASFDFWRTAETQSSTNGSPFASPSPLKSNINGGIGIWEGFSYTLDTVVAL
jgi:Domain of unknown function (DUF4249)